MGAMKIHEAGCKKQQEDLQAILTAVDDIGAASLALASGSSQGYTQFIQARENFKLMINELGKNYRYVE
jgi:23S rRNA pseudoU1915 N3-methylase RlmH